MILQLNTGNLIDFSYVPTTSNFVTGVSGTGTVEIGTFSVQKNSLKSLMNIFANLSLNLTTPGGVLNTFIFRIIRNNDTASPIFEDNYSLNPNFPDLQIHVNYVDTGYLVSTPIVGAIEYTFELEYTLVNGTTFSMDINTIFFAEESDSTPIVPNIMTV